MKTTLCKTCQKSIPYTTKKPLRCEACKDKSSKGKKNKKRVIKSKNTKTEQRVFKILNDILPEHDYINHGFYSFLKSLKGYPLQLDRFYPDLQLAFEIDGRQHHEYTPFIHRSKSQYMYYKKSDELKNQGCKDKGIELVRIISKPSTKKEDIWEEIKKQAPNAYIALKKGRR